MFDLATNRPIGFDPLIRDPGTDLNRTQITAGRDAHHRPRGVAADELRRHNLAALLERLHLLGPTSRSDLTATMGLNRSTIGDLIGELAALGLVEEGPAQASSGPGRPSPIVRTRPEGAIVLAAEFSVDSVAVATVGLGGHVFGQTREPRPRARVSADSTIRHVGLMAHQLLETLPRNSSLVGVGAGVAGVTRRSDGFVHQEPNLGWRNVAVGEKLSSMFGADQQVLVANEADLGALAEHRRGVGAGVPDLIYLSGEAGIGAGMIHDGKPMLGAAGYAGEAGHTLVNPDGHDCRCGAKGCWETEAGEEALARHAGIPPSVGGVGMLETVLTRAEAGDERTVAAIAEVGRWLGLGIGNLINVFNPQLVVLGGLYHPLFPFLEKAVHEGARLTALDAPGDVAEIAAGGLGADAPLLGAAELALSSVIADPAGSRRAGAG
jgi:predicted NBD/HSP70 family sugar kinase